MAADPPLWSPTTARVEAAALTRFTKQKKPELVSAGYGPLHRWSIEHRAEFWSALWDFAGIVGDKGAPPYLLDEDCLPGSRWFPAARLNYAENLLRRRDNHTALIGVLENGERSSVSYRELHQRVAGLATALTNDGVGLGDRVAGYLPNVIDTVVAMLATSSIGAMWSSCSPDFGHPGLLDRFGQIEPKVLFTADGYYYNGKRHDSLARIAAALPELPSVIRVVVIPVVGDSPAIGSIESAVILRDYIDPAATECRFERLPFDHPLFIMYSSGTTGRPKCIVHSAGGALLEHQKEHLLHTDIGPDDIFFYYTTCGWMMWNWLVSGLACGSTVVLYDGAPGYRDPDSLMRLIEQERLTVFGTSAKYISMREKENARPGKRYDLGSLQTLLSTGSPLAPESFHYVYKHIKQDVLLSSIAGGTDILGAFASGNPCLPVYAGELQCLGLGMAVDVADDQGQSIRQQKGELICRRSFPSVPAGFWNDPDNSRFHAAYFARFEKVWTHGDYAEITTHDGMIIHGRSDALLNPGGVRIGTAEIYRQVEKVPAVVESVAVGQAWGGDCRVILFVRLHGEAKLTDAIVAEIRQTIRANTTPRHVPAKIIQVLDIPRTRSGKIAEIAVRKVISGDPVDNTEALANPESLSQFMHLRELRE
jgi:acetoacetyl-CoA synthetase